VGYSIWVAIFELQVCMMMLWIMDADVL